MEATKNGKVSLLPPSVDQNNREHWSMHDRPLVGAIITYHRSRQEQEEIFTEDILLQSRDNTQTRWQRHTLKHNIGLRSTPLRLMEKP